jgi:hypothetical protein
LSSTKTCVNSPSVNIATAVVGGVAVVCPVGCSVCPTATTCSTCMQGFALQSNTCVKCDKSCSGCSATNPN